jgi:MGT family glycosyltransferase
MSAQADGGRRRFLFTLWEGGGNVPPQLELARRLVERGHDVRVMSDRCNEREARSAGCAFVAYTRAPSRRDKSAASTLLRDYEAGNPLQAFLMFRDQVMIGPALDYARDVLDELRRTPTDALVINDGLLGPMLAAEQAGLPYAMVLPHHYIYPAPGLPPPGMISRPPRNVVERARDRLINGVILRAFDGGLPALNTARAALGLPPDAHLLDPMHRADRVLVLTSPAFDFTANRLPPNVRYVGPVLDEPAGASHTASPEPLPNGAAPLVVVSFSTTFQNQRPVVQRVIDAIGKLPVRGLVTTGPALDAAELRAPANVTVRGFVPHGQLLPHAAAVVTHAGHGTVIRALAHGVPLVCIPMGRDQNGNAARVVARQAGKALPVKATAEALHDAIDEVITTPIYRQKARLLAEQITRDAQASLAISELEGLVPAAERRRIARGA